MDSSLYCIEGLVDVELQMVIEGSSCEDFVSWEIESPRQQTFKHGCSEGCHWKGIFGLTYCIFQLLQQFI
jgi:hypothetical protein